VAAPKDDAAESVADVINLVRRRGQDPVDEREARSVDIFLIELARLERPFDEHADAVHVTASVLITGARGVILLKHKKLGIWVQPGGHIDDGETPAQAAVREAVEETGLPVTLLEPEAVQVDVHPGPRGHTHLDLRFLCTAPDEDPRPPEGESQDVYWFGWDDAIAMADDGIAGLLKARRP
jgi:8-oxo-dGTP pyrophosphatase MutT (NUDIX family)